MKEKNRKIQEKFKELYPFYPNAGKDSQVRTHISEAKINGDKALGTSYCLVTLIGVENGKKVKTSIGVYYEDEYVRQNNHWLIAKRKSVFDWQEKRELSQ